MKNRRIKGRIPNDKYRIIKISKEALIEFIYESINDKEDEYFNAARAGRSKACSIETMYDIDLNTGDLICIARAEKKGNERLQFDNVDTELLISKLKDTTATMFQPKRYIELSTQEIEDIQNGKPSIYVK